MKKLLFAFVLIWIALIAQARSVGGYVCDSLLNPIEGVSVQLWIGDSILAGNVSGPEGYFMMGTNESKEILLIVAKKGYSGHDIIVEAGFDDVDLGKIEMYPANELKELKVESSSVYQSRGRTLIYPSKSEIESSQTSLDLFQRLLLPGLSVNPINRSVSVMGQSPVILINGVPSNMDDLNALQPKEIERIEYSQITPVRYANRGSAGFINIKLKERKDGGLVYAYASSGLNSAMVDATLRGSYHQGPSQFTVTYTPSWRNCLKVYDHTEGAYIGNDFRVDYESDERAPFNYLTNNVALRYEYVPTEKTVFSATASFAPFSNKNRSVGTSKDSFLGDYDFTNLNTSKAFTPSLDLYLRHDFNPKNMIEVEVLGTLISDDYRRNNVYRYPEGNYYYPEGNVESYKYDIDSRRRSLISEVAYVHMFNVSTELIAGFRNTLSYSKNTYLDKNYTPVLKENNNYAYAALSHMFGNFYVKASTGMQIYNNNNAGENHSYTRNLSSVMAQWVINQKWSMAAYVSYTPSIPLLASLTDYMQQVSPYLWTNGNPDLKVAYSLGYQFHLGFQHKKFRAILFSTFNDNKNAVFNDMSYLGDGQFLMQAVNSTKCQNLKNTLQLGISDIYGFGANITLGIDYYNSRVGNWSKKLTEFNAVMSLWWTKGPYTVKYYRNFPGKYLSGYMAGRAEQNDILSFNYKLNDHIMFGAQWMKMFSKSGIKYPTWNYSDVNPYSRMRYIKDNINGVLLTVTYNTNFGAIFKSGRQRGIENKDNGTSLMKI